MIYQQKISQDHWVWHRHPVIWVNLQATADMRKTFNFLNFLICLTETLSRTLQNNKLFQKKNGWTGHFSFLGNGLHLYCSYQRTVAYNILVLFASFLFLVLLKSFGSQLFSQCGPIIIYLTNMYYFNCCFSTKPWSKILYPCKVFHSLCILGYNLHSGRNYRKKN